VETQEIVRACSGRPVNRRPRQGLVLDRYLQVATLKVLVLASAGLTALFSLLELVNQLHDVGRGRYRLIDALVYVLLTAPARLLQLMPVSMLLATLFALGSLASHNELTVMRATGVSALRIIGSVFKLLGPVVIVLFLAAQFVIPRAEQLAQAERTSRLAASSAPLRTGNSFWAAGDHTYVNVRRFDHGNVPANVYVYVFGTNGRLTTLMHAGRADVRPDGTWLLTDVLRKRFNDTGSETDQLAALSWHSFLRPREVPLLILPPESMPPIELYQYVRDLERRQQPAARYARELWAKIAIPLAMAAMIIIAVPFLFGPLRAHGAGQRVMIGAMIGVVFSLLQQMTGYLGLLLHFDPALAATVPSLMVMAAAFWPLRRAAL
jgi:lipopolysaccharide export system permease protein